MEGIVNIPNWTLVPIVSWTGLWFSVPVLPQPFNRYFDWRVDWGQTLLAESYSGIYPWMPPGLCLWNFYRDSC